MDRRRRRKGEGALAVDLDAAEKTVFPSRRQSTTILMVAPPLRRISRPLDNHFMAISIL